MTTRQPPCPVCTSRQVEVRTAPGSLEHVRSAAAAECLVCRNTWNEHFTTNRTTPTPRRPQRRMHLVETCWELRRVDGRVLTCALYDTTSEGVVEVRLGFRGRNPCAHSMQRSATRASSRHDGGMLQEPVDDSRAQITQKSEGHRTPSAGPSGRTHCPPDDGRTGVRCW